MMMIEPIDRLSYGIPVERANRQTMGDDTDPEAFSGQASQVYADDNRPEYASRAPKDNR
jgi:hypothetical protein